MDLILLALLTSAPARGADTFEGFRFAYGDPHAHTGLSGDGGSSDLAGTCRATCGSTTDMFDSAVAAGLDWLAITDHVNGENTADVALYEAMHARILAADDPDAGFVTVPAAEVWFELRSGAPIGHRSLLLFGTDEELAPLTLSDLQIDGTRGIRVDDCSGLDDYMTRVSAVLGNALLFPHHPALTRPMPSDWTCVDELWSPAVEVYSAHGNSLWEGVTFDPPWSGTTTTGTAHYGMDPDGLGLQLGFFAGTDAHDSSPGSVCDLDPEHRNHPYGGGLTVAVLDAGEAFDRGALYRAFVERRVYATSGPRVPVVVAYDSGGAKLGGMGQTLGLPAGQDLTVEVRVPEEWADYVLSVEVTLPDTRGVTMEATGVGTWAVTIPGEDVPAFVYPTLTLDGAAIYAAETCVDGGATADEHIWLSPSFLEEVAGDLDGDGYDVRAGDCHDGDASIHPDAAETWDDGVDQDCDGYDGPTYTYGALSSAAAGGAEPAAPEGGGGAEGDGVVDEATEW
ncbi:MAG: MopE-related protein, partial [Myxococcota bacterium]